MTQIRLTMAPAMAAVIATTALAACLEAAPAPPTTERQIHYRLDQPGQVSLAVYGSQGHLLRELKRGEPHAAGEHALVWDGLDRYGNAMPPGDYEWRLLRNDGFRAEYLLSIGVNPKSAPYDPWVGNHQSATALMVDPKGFMYAGSAGAENAPALLRQTLDGSKVFWHNIGSLRHGPVNALAWSGDRLLQFSVFRKVHVRDPETGRETTQYDVRLPDMPELHWGVVPKGVDAKDLTFQERRRQTGELRQKYFENLPAHMSASKIAFAVSERLYDLVRWFDVDTGKVLGSFSLSEPKGLAMSPEGMLYAISGDQIVRFDPGSYENPVEVLPGGVLANPIRIAWDPTDGSLWVAHGKERASEVSHLSADGQLLKTFGRPGGRGFGPYVAEDFYNIVDIASDRQGGFIVAETGDETFRRTARFSRQGKLLIEWYGGQQWGSFVAFDPENPNRVLFTAGKNLKALAEVDYDACTYRVTHLLRAEDTAGLMPSLTRDGALWQLRRVDGELYLMNFGGHTASSAPAVYRADLEAGLAIPVARSGNVNGGQVWDFEEDVIKEDAPGFWLEAMKRKGIAINRRMILEDAWSGYSWSDENGNGKIDPDEIHFGPAMRYQSLFKDADWNLLLADSPANPDKPFIYHVPNRNPDGTPPRWDWKDAEPTPYRSPAEFANLGNSGSVGVFRDRDGSVYVFAKANAHPRDDKQGDRWPAVNSGSSRVLKWNEAGEFEWSVGQAASVNEAQPGKFHEPMRILGTHHGNVVVQDRVVCLAQVFTPDGLYAGNFLQGRVDDGLPPEVYHTATWAHQPGLFLHDHIASVMEVTDDGQVLFNPSGRNGAPVYRIHGWKGWTRQRGTVAIETPPIAAARQGVGLTGTYFANLQWEGEPVLQRTDAELWFGNRTLPATQDKSGREWKLELAAGEFSARWVGKIEAPFSEPFTFYVSSEYGSQVKLWLNDQEVISEQQMPLHRGRRSFRHEGRTVRTESQPIPLEAGQRYLIRLDYTSGGKSAQLHLIWESDSQERQHVPTELLYPGLR